MVNKIVILASLGVIFIAAFFLFYPSQKNNLKICDSKTIESSYVGEKPVCYDESIYQGPVRPTDDENNFRQTGKTIPMENKN